MELKNKTLGFIPKNNLFISIDEEDKEIKIVAFGYDNIHIRKAREIADNLLKDDIGYKELDNIYNNVYTEPSMLKKKSI